MPFFWLFAAALPFTAFSKLLIFNTELLFWFWVPVAPPDEFPMAFLLDLFVTWPGDLSLIPVFYD